MNKAILEVSSRPENVAFARLTIAAFASQLDFTVPDLEEIKVAVSEALTNSIVHGYGNSPDHMVRLEATIVEEFLEIEVIDTGKGIEDIPQALTPAFSTDPERMGLGFAFMHSFMENLQVTSEPGKGVKVKMSKRAGVFNQNKAVSGQ